MTQQTPIDKLMFDQARSKHANGDKRYIEKSLKGFRDKMKKSQQCGHLRVLCNFVEIGFHYAEMSFKGLTSFYLEAKQLTLCGRKLKQSIERHKNICLNLAAGEKAARAAESHKLEKCLSFSSKGFFE
jgi:hypothetical protein